MSKYGEVFESIAPNFKDIMSDLILNDPINSKSHDEGNYDVDRMDYLLRDALYGGKKLESYTHEQYKRKYARIDNNGDVMKNADGSIVLSDEKSNENKIPIDVYGRKSLEAIENFLELRVQVYKNIYFSGETQVSDFLVGKFVEYVIEHEDPAKELKTFIDHLKTQDVNIDLQEFLIWDDIRLKSNCIEIGESSKNVHTREFAGMVIPNLEALMYITYSHLDMRNQSTNLSEYDYKFIKKIKELIESNSNLSLMLKDKDYYRKNCFICTDNEKIEHIKSKFGNKVSYKDATVKAYKSSIPIYIEDKNGNVYALHEHPEKKCDWENRKETVNVAFVAIPCLKIQGLSDKEINEIKETFQDQGMQNINKNNNSKEPKINMSPVRVDSNIEDYFCI